MKPSLTLAITILVCVSSLLLDQVAGRPYNSLSVKDREDIIHFAAKIVKLALGEEQSFVPNKRNSGMLDAVINMPDLFKAGRK